MDQRAIQQAAEAIVRAKRCVALTGAGISVDSGIPDFRSPGGLWERFDPMDYAHIDSFRASPRRVWGMLKEMRAVMTEAKPNPGHLALAELERLKRLQTIITQNIDNLHQDAGSGDVIEFHGNAHRFSCLRCGKIYARDQVESGALGFPPECACGFILKPDIVFFGEAIPTEALERSIGLAQQADMMLIVGTSATVAPANVLPTITRARGGSLIEINLERTHLGNVYGAMALIGSSSEVLPALVEGVRALLLQ